ncbi:hypothetical protein KXX46_003896 [Aspergillus fumigatus]|nr:hypothetical protein CNMCM8689_007021 [Aspergillus fumigatus]KAH1368779.1 hypothetical protein KXX63_008614 [Aspergillus fumigatus]KAH1668912.1 hypothetical protein KXX46_003896 [Aspergillus fumigatus]KAH2134380.1 hypothetical protein KXW66_005014 [Aspergillus fumigatus]KAH2510915.1 hypothetical protein KXW70_008392 [Aspergillus fumigatus]
MVQPSTKLPPDYNKLKGVEKALEEDVPEKRDFYTNIVVLPKPDGMHALKVAEEDLEIASVEFPWQPAREIDPYVGRQYPRLEGVEKGDELSIGTNESKVTLAGVQLIIDDVIIFDMFPMVQKDQLEATDQKGQAKPDNGLWSLFNHKLARQLCSSIDEARDSAVLRVEHTLELEGVLKRRFAQIAKLYGAWKSQQPWRAAAQQVLRDGSAMLV